MTAQHDQILIIDFGSQVTQLIGRRVREMGVYSEIIPFQSAEAAFHRMKPKAVILSGGPDSVTRDGSPRAPQVVFDSGLPILAICYGQQTTAVQLGGVVEGGHAAEFGRADIEVKSESALFEGLWKVGERHPVWMSHGDRVTKLPAGFTVKAVSENAPFAIASDEARRIYTTMFHPEVVHTPDGAKLIRKTCSRNVGRVDQRFRHVEPAPLRVIIAYLEATDFNGCGRIDTAAKVSNDACVDRIRHRQHLEGAAQFVDALRDIVPHGLGIRFAAAIWVEDRQRNHRNDLACVHIENEARGANGLQVDHGSRKFAFHCRLHTLVDRKRNRFSASERIGKAVIQDAFHPHHAAAVKIGIANDMGSEGRLRIESLRLTRIGHGGFTQSIHRCNQFRHGARTEIGKGLSGFQDRKIFGLCAFGHEPRKLRGKVFRTPQKLVGMHPDRPGLDGARKNFAIAINNVATSRQPRSPRSGNRTP